MGYSLALNQVEKKAVPSLKLHNSIEVLNNYQKNLGKTLRANKQEEKEVVKFNKNKSEKSKKIFLKDVEKVKKQDTRFRALADKHIEEGVCTTRDLNRIMLCFDEPEFQGKQLYPADFKDFCNVTGGILTDGLKFLARHKIITEINDRGRYYYQKNG